MNIYLTFTVFQEYVIKYIDKDEQDAKIDSKDPTFHSVTVTKLSHYHIVP